MSELTKSLGETIKKYRKLRGYSTQAFSKKFDISCGLINNIEHDKSDFFKIDLLMNIIKELDIPLNEIKTLADQSINEISPNSIESEINNVLVEDDFEEVDYLNTYAESIIQSFFNAIHHYEDKQEASVIISSIILKTLESLQNLKEIR
jgi:transcriptional regulator with XRE-family HTH domain